MPRRNEKGPARKGSARRAHTGKSASFSKPFRAAPANKRAGSSRRVSKQSPREEEPKSAGVFNRKKAGFRGSASSMTRAGGKSGKGRFASDEGRSGFAAGKKARYPGGTPSRGESFGKPYKKSYRTKSIHEKRAGARSTGNVHKRKAVTAETTSSGSAKIRLNKFIANSGVSSRREADELISMGLISVNGKVVTELGHKINPGDEVRYEDKVLRAEKPVYILMNKPKGFITTTDDPQERKTVMHLLGSAVKERIYPVGRLDRNTTGLLLLTNDGDLADKLMHPSFNVRKVYKVELDKPLTRADFQAIAEGVRLEEGRATVDDLAIISDDKRTVGIELHIGWNRVVRRVFESLGYEVIRLDRTVYAGLDKKDLGRGEWRFLKKDEIIHLKHFQ